MKKHNFAVWSIIFFLTAFIFIIYPAIYIFLVDPLWQWDHPWHLARWHRAFNERLQKTNYLASHNLDSFNDAHHPTEAISKQITKIILGIRTTDMKKNCKYCGIVLTPENVGYWISTFRRQFTSL